MKKLVRDNLEKVIPANLLSVCKPEEKLNWLIKKFHEESQEIIDSDFNDPYEYADLITVMLAIGKEKGFDADAIPRACDQKLSGFGGFEKGLIYDKPNSGKDV